MRVLIRIRTIITAGTVLLVAQISVIMTAVSIAVNTALPISICTTAFSLVIAIVCHVSEHDHYHSFFLMLILVYLLPRILVISDTASSGTTIAAVLVIAFTVMKTSINPRRPQPSGMV